MTSLLNTVQDMNAKTLAITQTARLQTSFEWYWANYISKLARLDELKANGRYGYQLRMPKKAIHNAAQAMRDFCKANGIECPPCV